MKSKEYNIEVIKQNTLYSFEIVLLRRKKKQIHKLPNNWNILYVLLNFNESPQHWIFKFIAQSCQQALALTDNPHLINQQCLIAAEWTDFCQPICTLLNNLSHFFFHLFFFFCTHSVTCVLNKAINYIHTNSV